MIEFRSLLLTDAAAEYGPADYGVFLIERDTRLITGSATSKVVLLT